jgi:hypothetical protein
MQVEKKKQKPEILRHRIKEGKNTKRFLSAY